MRHPITAAALMGCALTGCSPRAVQPSVEYRDRVEYTNNYVHDTVYESHTDYIYAKNDTIFHETSQYIYKERLVHDTIVRESVDSISYRVEVPVYVEKSLKGWQKFLMWAGAVSLLALIFFVIWKIKV